MSGWKAAWKDIFDFVENASLDGLKELSSKLWNQYQYDEDEEDRVVLYVAITANKENGESWEASLSVDAKGVGWQSAMANTVSYTVAQAVNAIMDNRLAAGVQAAPHDITEAKKWLNGIKDNGIDVKAVNINL